MTTNETVKAKEDAEKIAERLNQMKQSYPHGARVSKASLRQRFDLPVNRSVKVWAYLVDMGFISEAQAIVIPASEEDIDKKQVTEQPTQQQQPESKEDDELGSILND